MSKAKDAELILRLYELRRDPIMREARNWMVGFFPESAQDIINAMINPESSAYFRMVTSYWDMACSFVNHEAIDEDIFNEANGEHVIVFAKIEPHLPELREMMGNPRMFKNLETHIMKMENAKELLSSRREMIRRMVTARAEMAKAKEQS